MTGHPMPQVKVELNTIKYFIWSPNFSWEKLMVIWSSLATHASHWWLGIASRPFQRKIQSSSEHLTWKIHYSGLPKLDSINCNWRNSICFGGRQSCFKQEQEQEARCITIMPRKSFCLIKINFAVGFNAFPFSISSFWERGWRFFKGKLLRFHNFFHCSSIQDKK